MSQNNSTKPVDEDKVMKSQMEKIAPSYDSYMRKVTFGKEHILREETIRLAQIQPGDCILEVGCGTGTLTLAAKRQAGPLGKAFGIDVIPEMIELSQHKASQANEDITFQLGSIDNLPFPANYFDAVMCSFMIFHMSDATRQKGITEIHRVLKPQGRLLVLDLALPTQPLQKAIVQTFFGSMAQHDIRELQPVMSAIGYTNIEIAPVKFRVMGLSILGSIRGQAGKN